MAAVAEPPRDPVMGEATTASVDAADPGRAPTGLGVEIHDSDRRDVQVEEVLVSSWTTPEDGEPEPDGMVLKLATKDPEIVLYWIVGQNGD